MTEINEADEWEDQLEYFLDQLQIRGMSEEESKVAAEAFIEKFGKQGVVDTVLGRKKGYRVAWAMLDVMKGES